MRSRLRSGAMSDSGGPQRPSVGLVGDLDSSTIAQAEALVRDVLQSGATEVTIDMGLVTFFGAAGVHMLVDLLDQGVQLELVDVPTAVRRVLTIFGLDHHPWVTLG